MLVHENALSRTNGLARSEKPHVQLPVYIYIYFVKRADALRNSGVFRVAELRGRAEDSVRILSPVWHSQAALCVSNSRNRTHNRVCVCQNRQEIVDASAEIPI